MFTIESRVTVLEMQQSRFISDIESEKGTRARMNKELVDLLVKIDDRLRRCEWLIAMGLGGIALLKWLS